MEASKINQFFVAMVVVMMMAASNVSAQEAPAPSPTSDATTLFVPTIMASFVALVFGFVF
ncbi:arabinogalactan protein 21-like [Vicia villosa]|uniref:arabinogalactan protein 21-like n=1 Tax=Vicia villosa TaxID=3911 RepID=UPI00273AAC7B|nr:arabinogalactan protein 21-like [Vicia villosa]